MAWLAPLAGRLRSLELGGGFTYRGQRLTDEDAAALAGLAAGGLQSLTLTRHMFAREDPEKLSMPAQVCAAVGGSATLSFLDLGKMVLDATAVAALASSCVATLKAGALRLRPAAAAAPEDDATPAAGGGNIVAIAPTLLPATLRVLTLRHVPWCFEDLAAVAEAAPAGLALVLAEEHESWLHDVLQPKPDPTPARLCVSSGALPPGPGLHARTGGLTPPAAALLATAMRSGRAAALDITAWCGPRRLHETLAGPHKAWLQELAPLGNQAALTLRLADFEFGSGDLAALAAALPGIKVRHDCMNG